MFNPTSPVQGVHQQKKRFIPDWPLLVGSIFLQGFLAYFFGHAYDTRILMATGYLVANGQNPYIAQNLGVVFHNSTFQGITTLGYPPPWALILGLVYLCSYRIIPDFLLYNLAIKLPIIAANICLAYAVQHILNKSGVQAEISRTAWIFLLFNPFLLLTTSAWGQFDSVIALLSLLSLFLLSEGGLIFPAILLALAISLKPIALPLIFVTLVFLAGKSLRRTLQYFAVFTLSMLLFCVVPFIIFKWNPSEILQH
jgi:Gpi18-like mannosyltransferase